MESFLAPRTSRELGVQEIAKLLNKVLTRNMKCSQTQSGEPRRWTCRYLLTHGIGRFIRVLALTLFRWLQYMQRKDMTIVWTACGGSGLDIYLERSTYLVTEGLHWPCVSGSPVPAPVETTSGTWGGA